MHSQACSPSRSSGFLIFPVKKPLPRGEYARIATLFSLQAAMAKEKKSISSQGQRMTMLACVRCTILGLLFITPQTDFNLASHDWNNLPPSLLVYPTNTPYTCHESTNLACLPDRLPPNFRQPDILEQTLLLQSLQSAHYIFKWVLRLFHPRRFEYINGVGAAELGKAVRGRSAQTFGTEKSKKLCAVSKSGNEEKTMQCTRLLDDMISIGGIRIRYLR